MLLRLPVLSVPRLVETQSPTTKVAIGIFLGAVLLVVAGMFL